jgi:hypothetical protein
VKGGSVSLLEVLMAHIHHRSQEGFDDPFERRKAFGFEPQCILSVEINGYKDGAPKKIIVHCLMPYPFFEGKHATCSMEYGSYVGLPCSVSIQMLSQNQVKAMGAMTIENSDASPKIFLSELERRNVRFTRQS